MNIEKKIWPENFEKILSRENSFELRLADFEISVGDNLILKEFNPITKDYTGRMMIRQVLEVNKFKADEIENIDLIVPMYNKEQLNKFGLYYLVI